MDEASQKSKVRIAPKPATSSQGSEAGPSGLSLQGGLQGSLFGQGHAPANPSAKQESSEDSRTSGTSGQSGASLSPSARLQLSLESKLGRILLGCGSPLYVLTWKRWDMRSGPQICALRASVRRAKDSESISELLGWPTPNASVANDSDTTWMERRKKHGNNGFGLSLSQAASTTGWPTPTANEAKDGIPTIDQKNSGRLGRVVWTTSTVPMATTGRLRPGHARWLMGYPSAWCDSAVTAMQSYRNSSKSS